MKVSIIIPTYNERENIIPLIDAILRFISEAEIIVVDDDSPDQTWKAVEDYNHPNVKLIRRTKERGLATAIKAGLKESKADLVGWLDADMCMPASTLPALLRFLDEYDIAIGSRYREGARDTRGIFRVVTSRIINWFARALLGSEIKDYTSGFIVLKRYLFDKVSLPSDGYGDYFIEFIYKCKRAGFKIKEVSYTFSERKDGESKTVPNIFAFFKLGFGYILRIIHLRFYHR